MVIIKNKEDDYTIGLTNNIGGVCKHEKNPIVSYRTNKIKGVPLSEQWLLDLFSKENGYPYKMLNGYIRIRNGVYFFKFYTLEVELPYVHTLQNLYYSLTNKELK